MRKYSFLDLIRFFLALFILMYHYNHYFIFFDIKSNLFILTTGDYFVKSFWIISGFIFQFYYSNLIIHNKINFKNFFILRFCRLYPLHFFTLLLTLVLQIIFKEVNGTYFIYQFNDVKHFIMNIFFVNYFEKQSFSFNAPIWSVAAEIPIYCLFFYFNKKIFSFLENILLVIILFFLKSNIDYFDNIISCGRYFFIGCVISVIVESNKFLSFIKNVHIPYSEFLGNLTYSSYLLHFPIQIFTILFFMLLKIDIKLVINNNIFFIFYLSLNFIVSYFVYKYFEKPMQLFLKNKLL